MTSQSAPTSGKSIEACWSYERVQLSLDFLVEHSNDSSPHCSQPDGGLHGVVLTKPHVVELLLDLAGYTRDLDLSTSTLLEPSCGHGAFLVQAVRRLLESARRHDRDFSSLGAALVGFDIKGSHVAQTRDALIAALLDSDVAPELARRLASQWVKVGDFLLEPFAKTFDFVVGNPPYVRLEQISHDLRLEYRRRYRTVFDRADLYIAFIERGLRLLSPKGILSFVCANRWTLNRYGVPLRKLIASTYEVRTYIDLHNASPFDTKVIAYPSIFVIAREILGGATRVITLSNASPSECALLSQGGFESNAPDVNVVEYSEWFAGGDPWVLASPQQLSTLRQLERRLPLLEESGNTTVRIGVATGNDSIYIVPTDADIETDRLVPLVMRQDITSGTIKNAHRCVINTFEAKHVIELSKYPRLHRYLNKHAALLRRRHVAQRNLDSWFRTIDRVYPALVSKPKLLIPDIADSNDIAFEPGCYYPHHNLYFVISDVWDMEVLGGLLSSRVALFFLWSYAVKMRGGYLRFQAQYLRRIRVPRPEWISENLQHDIRTAFRRRDFPRLDDLACATYDLPRPPEFDFVDTRS